jgi:DNA-binding CsgD family transcriptional regulator
MGMNTREVADKLFISNHTVETHRKNLLSKTESKNIAELIVWGVSRGYIFPQP